MIVAPRFGANARKKKWTTNHAPVCPRSPGRRAHSLSLPPAIRYTQRDAGVRDEPPPVSEARP